MGFVLFGTDLRSRLCEPALDLMLDIPSVPGFVRGVSGPLGFAVALRAALDQEAWWL